MCYWLFSTYALIVFVLRTQKTSVSLVLPLRGWGTIQGQFHIRIRADHAGYCLTTELSELPVRLPKQALFTHSEKLQDVAIPCRESFLLFLLSS